MAEHANIVELPGAHHSCLATWLADRAEQLQAGANPLQLLTETFGTLTSRLGVRAFCWYVSQDGKHWTLHAHCGVEESEVSHIDHFDTEQESSLTTGMSTGGLCHRLGLAAAYLFPFRLDESQQGLLALATDRTAMPEEDLQALRLFCLQLAWALQRDSGLGVRQAARATAFEARDVAAILDVLPVGVFLVDRDGRLIVANSSALAIWGRLPAWSLTLQDYAEDYAAYWPGTNKPIAWERRVLARAFRGERVTAEEIEIVRPDGRRSVLVQGAPLLDAEGTNVGAVGVAVDVTDVRRAQKQLAELKDGFETRIRERTRSLVNYQEHLRAMTSELILVEQRERRRLATELHDYLAQLLVAGKMKSKMLGSHLHSPAGLAALNEMRGLLDEALKYTRMLISDLSPTILYEAGLYAAIHWLGDRMRQHQLTVHVEAEGEPVEMPDDEGILVYQAVRELLLNVAKHAKVPEATVRIAHLASQELVVTVTDRGSGFDPAHQERDPADGKFGLFSVRERLAALGGEFEIQSGPNRGTRATVRVPLPDRGTARVHSPFVHGIRSSSGSAARTGDRVVRVLLVDDHKMVREGFRSLIECDPTLEVAGEAANGEEAIDQARTLRPDVIVMDINMPKMNGIEATRRIKSEMPNVAIIGLSVHDDRSLTASMLEAGASYYLTKGGPSEDLARAIHDARAVAPAQ